MPLTLALNLVTRGRPDQAVDTVLRTLPNIALAATRLMISVDEDDPTTIAAVNPLEQDSRVIVDVRPREDALGAKYNRVLDLDADVYLSMCDYGPHVTPGFDQRICEAASLFPDGIGAVFNHNANLSFSGIVAATRSLTDRLGYYFPPYFPYWFVDHWLEDIARLIGRIAFTDVHQAIVIKPETQERREPAFWATFYDTLRLVRRRQALDIINSPYFAEPEWRREILRRAYPLVEFRSQAINDYVRATPWHEPTYAGGDRYDRLRAAAVEIMRRELPALEEDMRAAALSAVS